MLKGGNRSLRAVTKVLEQDKKDLEFEIAKLRAELEVLSKESSEGKKGSNIRQTIRIEIESLTDDAVDSHYCLAALASDFRWLCQ